MLIIIVVLLITTYFPNTGLSSLNGNDNKQPVLGIFYDMELIITRLNGDSFTVLYDDSDHNHVSSKKWYISNGKHPYAATTIWRNGKAKKVYLHRWLLGISDTMVCCDHINRNVLDNRRANLRVCTKGQNNINKSFRKGGTSKYNGVHWVKSRGKWGAYIGVNGKHFFIGRFASENEAAMAYNKKAIETHGEFANLNIIE